MTKRMHQSDDGLDSQPSLEQRQEYTFQDEDPSNRPPYSRPPLDEFGEVKWRAHCQCGKVSYKLRRDRPLKAKFCHCRGCQVMHGAPFQWAAIFPKEDVRFDNGTSGMSFYAARENNAKATLIGMYLGCTQLSRAILWPFNPDDNSQIFISQGHFENGSVGTG